MNELKVRQLKQLINISTVLSPQEKQEWLGLLELMNDKQLTELEHILVPKPAVEPKVETGEVKTPSLSHISSLPNKVTIPQNFIKSTIPIKESTTEPIKVAVNPLEEKQKQAIISNESNMAVADGKNIEVSAGVQPKKQISIIRTPPKTPDIKADLNNIERNNTDIPEVIPPPAELSIEELENLSVSNLRNWGAKAFIKVLSKTASVYGYFVTLQEFEKSQLYKDYLEYGRTGLMMNGDSNKLKLTHSEFETIIDSIAAMQVNKT